MHVYIHIHIYTYTHAYGYIRDRKSGRRGDERTQRRLGLRARVYACVRQGCLRLRATACKCHGCIRGAAEVYTQSCTPCQPL